MARTQFTRTCPKCGLVFSRPNRRTVYCSNSCAYKPQIPKPVEERFWSKVEKRGPNECWLWKASCQPYGYGQTRDGKQQPITAHRLAWILTFGAIPPDKPFILHRCDNPPCVNPAHLSPGTPADNMRDMDTRGRRPLGEGRRNTRLNNATVLMLRASQEPTRALAERLKVGVMTVHNARYGNSWKHV